MTVNIDTKLKRNYLPSNLKIEKWESINEYFVELNQRPLTTEAEVLQWLRDKSELESVLEEDLAWRYIKMNCNTEDETLANSFNYFVTEIEPEISKFSDILNKKLLNTECISHLEESKYFVMIRALKKRVELFREKNVPLFAELQKMEQEYGLIASKMTIHYNNEEITLQKAANYLKETDRNTRKEVYELIANRRKDEIQNFNEILTRLINKRHQVALNAGFKNFKEYKYQELGRFDYTADDVQQFHQSIRDIVVPVIDQLYKLRKEKLNLDRIKPYDLDVDENYEKPLKPFKQVDELINKTIYCFSEINSDFGDYINIMNTRGYLDLDSRKGKAPGGFNYPLYESNIPFIFMNATGNLRDVETMVHEGGHAIHSFLSAGLELVDFKNLPSEVAELASMSMELISMEHWHHFFKNNQELKRAKSLQLEGILQVLPWIAHVDLFQNWIYENPEHTIDDRKTAWENIVNEYSSKVIDWSGYEEVQANLWQKQLHIFEVPFYYIEYGIAQLGAIAIWKNYRSEPKKTLEQYKNALSLGYTKSIPEIYEAAGIKFDFSTEYVSELIQFVYTELDNIKGSS